MPEHDDTPNLPGAHATELDETEAARWDALRSATAGLAEAVVSGTADEEDIAAASAQMRQIPIDLNRVLNAIHVPDDAGEHAAGLEAIMRRIPDGWGRWISCGPGWYPILVELDQRLAELFPDYELHQAKEKHAQLRYYWTPGPLACCRAFEAAHPRPDPHDEAAWEAWTSEREAHEQTEDHVQAETVARELYEQAEVLVADAERRAAVTCEDTGAPGVTMSSRGWLRTLDPTTAPEQYTQILENDESWFDWQAERAKDTDDALRLARRSFEDAQQLGVVANRLLTALREARAELAAVRAEPTDPEA